MTANVPQLQYNRILLVEDGPNEQAMIKKCLASAFPEAEIIIAENGRDAVDYALNDQFDFIIMDYQLPIKNGYQATVEIRQKENPAQKNIIITNSSVLFEPFKDKNNHPIADGYLIKEDKKSYIKRINEILLANSR